MGVGAVVASVVACFTVMTVLACQAVPDGVSGVDLFAEATSMGEWKGSGGATSWCILVMILWHSIPMEVPVVGVSYCCG